MKAIIGGRGNGRTYKLLQDASEENGLVICHSKGSARLTQNIAIEMYRNGQLKSVPEIVFLDEILSDNGKGRVKSKFDKRLFIDNTELILEKLFRGVGQIGEFVVCNDESLERGLFINLGFDIGKADIKVRI